MEDKIIKILMQDSVSDWISIDENNIPTDNNVFYFYAEGGKYYKTTPCNLHSFMITYNFLKGSEKPITHYKTIIPPNQPV